VFLLCSVGLYYFIFICAKYPSPLALALSSRELFLHSEEQDGVCSPVQWKCTGGEQCSGTTPRDALSLSLHALVSQESSEINPAGLSHVQVPHRCGGAGIFKLSTSGVWWEMWLSISSKKVIKDN